MSASRTTVRISLRISPVDFFLLQRKAALTDVSLQYYLLCRGCDRALPRRVAAVKAVADIQPDIPAASNDSLRTVFLQMRVSPADKLQLQQRAREHRTSLSDYLVRRGCGRPLSQPLDLNWLAAKRQLSRMSNNLGQLFVLLHAGHNVGRVGLEALSGALQFLDGQLRSIAPSRFPSLIRCVTEAGQKLNRLVHMTHRGFGLDDRLLLEIASVLHSAIGVPK